MYPHATGRNTKNASRWIAPCINNILSISRDFHTQQSVAFTQKVTGNKKHPVSNMLQAETPRRWERPEENDQSWQKEKDYSQSYIVRWILYSSRRLDQAKIVRLCKPVRCLDLLPLQTLSDFAPASFLFPHSKIHDPFNFKYSNWKSSSVFDNNFNLIFETKATTSVSRQPNQRVGSVTALVLNFAKRLKYKRLNDLKRGKKRLKWRKKNKVALTPQLHSDRAVKLSLWRLTSLLKGEMRERQARSDRR